MPGTPASPLGGPPREASGAGAGLPSDMLATPVALVRELQARIGIEAVALWCTDLLAARIPYDDPASPSLTWLSGGSAEYELRKGHLAERGTDYWPRVWGARGLLHGYEPKLAGTTVPVLVSALSDPHWRVREMTAKVIRTWDIGEAADALTPLVSDEVTRVRVAACRAIEVVGEAEHADALVSVLDDDERSVRNAARSGLDKMSSRLDRRLGPR
ncbi:MAG TPA: HEAT repeat domain-containing protein [Acidimicrobiales bacterium]|nr:HEAT repeat domain-containing protein [Acidimicrobiales bacterium]